MMRGFALLSLSLVVTAILGVACTTPDVSSQSSNVNGNRQAADTKRKPPPGDGETDPDEGRRESGRDARGTDDERKTPNGPAPSSCTTDGECGGAGRICQGTACVKGCRNELGCLNGQTCVGGQCSATSSSTKGTCTQDVDCALGQICNLTRCVNGCRSTGDCPVDESCSGGQCFFDPSTGTSSSSGTSGGAISCTQNADCALGKICTFQTCVAGCEADLDCPGTKICSLGSCI
jgi:hypothetical protein